MANATNLVPKNIGNAEEFLSSLNFPSLFFIDNKQEKTVLISGLLHGNEPSGLRAIVAWMKKELDFPFNILFMIGNVKAAKDEGLYSQRFLKGQEDFNRVWGDDSNHEIKKLLESALDKINLIGGVDVHNNTGKNPVYSIFASKNESSLELAEFLTDKILLIGKGNTLVNFMEKRGAQFVAVECGKCFDPEADEAAKAILGKVFDFFTKKVNGELIKNRRASLFGDIVEVEVKQGCTVSVASNADFVIRDDIEELNFVDCKEGTVIGVTQNAELPLQILKNGKDIASEWLLLDKNNIVMKQKGIILMAKNNLDNIRKCNVFYFGKKLY